MGKKIGAPTGSGLNLKRPAHARPAGSSSATRRPPKPKCDQIRSPTSPRRDSRVSATLSAFMRAVTAARGPPNDLTYHFGDARIRVPAARTYDDAIAHAKRAFPTLAPISSSCIALVPKHAGTAVPPASWASFVRRQPSAAPVMIIILPGFVIRDPDGRKVELGDIPAHEGKTADDSDWETVTGSECEHEQDGPPALRRLALPRDRRTGARDSMPP